MNTPVLSLTRIFLHNWHRFRHTVIDVKDGLYFTGHNGSGKSTILDAMQVVLLADLNLIKFNSSTQERSERNLNGFVRGKIFETKMLRPGKCVGYIALEFTESQTGSKTTLGCCIEAGESMGPNGERSYFILRDALDPTLFTPFEQALTRSELKKTLQKRHDRKYLYYDTFKEYQDDMLEALGGLNRRFFDRFRNALSFSPITKIDEFVRQWLLNEAQIDTSHLLTVVEQLDNLDDTMTIVKDKIALLSKIAEQQKSYQRNTTLQAQYEMFHRLLLKEQALRNVMSLNDEIKTQRDRHLHEEQKKITTNTLLSGAKSSRDQILKEFYALDVVKQKKILDDEIARKKKEAETIREQKKRLLQDMYTLSKILRQIEKQQFLQDDEKQPLRAMYEQIELLKLVDLLPVGLTDFIEPVSKVIKTVARRLHENATLITLDIQALDSKVNTLKQEIRALHEHGASATYSPSIEALRTRLEAVVGERPSVLCERLEVPDARWQIAVEAMLGERRFLILVPPDSYEEVLQLIERIKADSSFHNASVLDLEKVYKQRRAALPNSLALQVETNDLYLRAYIDSILGNIITCFSTKEVRQYSRAITSDLVYYSEWAVRVLSPVAYRRWFVGQRARASQIEARESELKQLQEQGEEKNKQLNQLKEEEELLDIRDSLSGLQKILENPPEDAYLRIEIEDLIVEQSALDLSLADELKKEADRLDGLISDYTQDIQQIGQTLGELKGTLDALVKDKEKATDELTDRENDLAELVTKHPTIIPDAEILFDEHKADSDFTLAIANAIKMARNYGTQSSNTMTNLHEHCVRYNTVYKFAGNPGDIQNDQYVPEKERLEATELPEYEDKIREARRDADQELREHVLHNLRERIAYAKDELRRINDALKPLEFNEERYQFRWDPSNDLHTYHDLIVDSQLLGPSSLFESEFYEKNKETFNRFYEEITRVPHNDAEKKVKERLTDYRSYLQYDIEVRHSDGSVSRLSNIVGETSGGETQTPFYLAVAASFVQLYHILDQKKRGRGQTPTIRLVVFDEAFNRMDQNRIEGTLDMLQRFGLQIVTATPLERCEYLVPKICTNLVLTRVGEEVHIEEYGNYAAKLEKMYGE